MGFAVNVTGLPWQEGFADATIVTLTGKMLLTTIGIWMLDAGLPDVQGSEEVSIQDTRSPFAGL